MMHGPPVSTILPPQQVKGGVIRLQVTENVIGRVRVEGATYRSPKDIREAVPALREGEVPDFRQAQQQLTDVNRHSGAQVLPVLTPGKLPQTMDVTLKVTDASPLHASLEVNNDHSVNTPELRTVASVRDDNLFQKGQAASLAGLAPVARQSGKWTGRAFIRGGRAKVRQALYMPALVSMRFNPDLKAKYNQLIAAGKAPKVAITAIMRKLIVLINALIRDRRKWTPALP